MLKRNRCAEDIVMGWIGVELMPELPGAVLEGYERFTTQNQIQWLWMWVPMDQALEVATTATTASTLVVIDSLNWLINHGMIWPDGSVSEWVGTWRRANAQRYMAQQLAVIHKADAIKHKAQLLKGQVEEMNNAKNNKVTP